MLYSRKEGGGVPRACESLGGAQLFRMFRERIFYIDLRKGKVVFYRRVNVDYTFGKWSRNGN